MYQGLLTLIVGLVLCSSNAFAHCGTCGVGDKGGHEHAQEKLKERGDEFSNKLNLTPEQKEQMKALREEKREKMKAMHEEMKKQKEALYVEHKAKVATILSPEQMQQWEKMKEDHEEMMGKCPECKDGKMCKKCKMKKGKSKKQDN